MQCAELLGTLASGDSAPAVSLIVQLLQVPSPKYARENRKSSTNVLLQDAPASAGVNTRALCAAAACNIALLSSQCSPAVALALPSIIAAVDSSDLLVRRTALLALTSAAHSHMSWLTPELTAALMDVLLRHVKLDESLMRQVIIVPHPLPYIEGILVVTLMLQVSMGPFKINVDDGADIRRLAVSAVAIMFEHHGAALCNPPLPPSRTLLNSIIARLSDKSHDVLLAAHALFSKMCRVQIFLDLVQDDLLADVCAQLSQPLADAAKEGAAQNEKEAFEARRRAAAVAVKALAEVLPVAALQSQVLVDLLASEAYAKASN